MNRAVILSVVFLLFCWQVNVFGQTPDFTDDMKMVDAYLASGDVNRALVVLEDVLIRDPSYLPAQEKKMDILLKNDREKDASKDIEEYISMYPTTPQYYYLRAMLNLQKQKYDKAIADFDKSIQLDMPGGTIYKVYLNRGMAHFSNGDYEDAEADFNEVIAIDSRNAAAYHGKGMVKYEMGQYEDALVEFQKSLKISPKNPIAQFNMGMTYFRLDEKEKACFHFNESCALGYRNACRLLLLECDIQVPK